MLRDRWVYCSFELNTTLISVHLPALCVRGGRNDGLHVYYFIEIYVVRPTSQTLIKSTSQSYPQAQFL